MIGQLPGLTLREQLLSVGRRTAAMVLVGGCLLWSAGCCRHGILLDFSIELNRVPWRTGCERCNSGCGSGEAGSAGEGQCAGGRCKRHAGADSLAGDPVLAEPVPSRFHPVPTKPVFSPAVAVVEELPPPKLPKSRKVRPPRPIPPEPADSEYAVPTSGRR